MFIYPKMHTFDFIIKKGGTQGLLIPKCIILALIIVKSTLNNPKMMHFLPFTIISTPKISKHLFLPFVTGEKGQSNS